MPNEVNKALRGLFGGGLGLAEGYFDKTDREDSDRLYKTSSQMLESMLSQYNNPGQDNDPELTNASKVDVEQVGGRRGQVTKVTKTPVKMSDILKKYYDVEANLSANFGEYGKSKAQALANHFGSMLKQPEMQYMELQDGTIAIINKNSGDIQYKTNPYFKPKEVKKKLTASDYANLTEEGALQLDISDIENGFYYMNPELQELLKKKYPILQQMYDKDFREGDYMPKRTSLRSSRSSSIPYNLKETERGNSLATIYKNNTGWNSMSEEDKATFIKEKQDLADQMGISQDELNKLAEDYANARRDNEKKEIVRGSLDQSAEVLESVDDIFGQIISNDFIHNMYMIDTATEDGLNSLIQAENDIWRAIGDNYNSIDSKIIAKVYDKALAKMNEVRKSKGLPLLERK